MPQIAETDEEVENCFDVMSELRPHLTRDEFLPLVRQMELEGYSMAYIQEGDEIVTVAGYRVSTNLHMGKHLYINDLVATSDARSKGYGAEMIRWLRDKAKSCGCSFFDLDSGTQRGRAHKFYFEQGFTIDSYHFSEKLVDS